MVIMIQIYIYIGTKNDYPDLESVGNKVISLSEGWISLCNTNPVPCNYTLFEIISFCGWIEFKSLKKLFPKKENHNIIRSLQYRKDGNFIMISIETEKFYYVINFATS